MATQVQVLFLSALDGEHLGFVLSVFLWLQKHLFLQEVWETSEGLRTLFSKAVFQPLNLQKEVDKLTN